MHTDIKSRTLKTFCLTVLTLLSVACGFHLKGYQPQDGKSHLTALYIKGINRYDDIAANLLQLAKVHNIKLGKDAEWSIRLSDEELERWQASTTQSITTSEYYLRLYVTLHIQHKDIVFKPIRLSVESIFQDNTDESSSKNNEQELIIGELRQQLAEDILQRVQYIASNPPDCDCNEPEPATTK